MKERVGREAGMVNIYQIYNRDILIVHPFVD